MRKLARKGRLVGMILIECFWLRAWSGRWIGVLFDGFGFAVGVLFADGGWW